MSQCAATTVPRTDWSLIWAQKGFRYFFFAMFISLFGSGMNFAGVSWHILALTHSTVKVSYQVIMATAPGLLVPFIGGVLIDRYDRRLLGIALDFSRGICVLYTAYVAWRGHLELWHLYIITLIIGVGSAMYWADVNALVQEVMPASQFTGANAAVVIGVQTGMLFAGALVGFIYDGAGIAGILLADGLTYFVSAWCLYKLRSGYVSPRDHLAKYPREFSESTEAAAEALATAETPDVAEAGLSLAVYSDLKEGVAYLRTQPTVRALGITHSILMAGVVSANVLVVALAADILHRGARGLGYLEAGWGLGAIIGGLLASQLSNRLHDALRAVARGTSHRPSLDAVDHLALRRRLFSSAFWILPLALRCRRAGFAHAYRSAPLHGTHAIRHGHLHHHAPTRHELRSRLDLATGQHLRRLRFPRPHLCARHRLRLPRPPPPRSAPGNRDHLIVPSSNLAPTLKMTVLPI
jgi:hypothetical protein